MAEKRQDPFADSAPKRQLCRAFPDLSEDDIAALLAVLDSNDGTGLALVSRLEIQIKQLRPYEACALNATEHNVRSVVQMWQFALWRLLDRDDFSKEFGLDVLSKNLGNLQGMHRIRGQTFWDLVVLPLQKCHAEYSDRARLNYWRLLYALHKTNRCVVDRHAVHWLNPALFACVVPRNGPNEFVGPLSKGDNPAWIYHNIKRALQMGQRTVFEGASTEQRWESKYKELRGDGRELGWAALEARLNAVASREEQFALLDARIDAENRDYRLRGCSSMPLFSRNPKHWLAVQSGRRLLVYMHGALECDAPILEAVWQSVVPRPRAAKRPAAQRALHPPVRFSELRPMRAYVATKAARMTTPDTTPDQYQYYVWPPRT
jgi:hypothetical protein